MWRNRANRYPAGRLLGGEVLKARNRYQQRALCSRSQETNVSIDVLITEAFNSEIIAKIRKSKSFRIKPSNEQAFTPISHQLQVRILIIFTRHPIDMKVFLSLSILFPSKNPYCASVSSFNQTLCYDEKTIFSLMLMVNECETLI